MNKFITLSTSTAVLSGLLLITGCSSDDGGSGVAVPANAVSITALNAFTLVQKATTTGYAISEATDGNSIPSGTADCTPTGSSENTIVLTGDFLTTSSEAASGSVTLYDCGTLVSGVPDTYFINGTLTVSLIESLSLTTGDITGTGTIIGNNIGLTINSMTAPTDTVTVNGLNTRRTSSEAYYGGGTYTVTSQFSYDSLTLKDGFFAQTTTPLEGLVSYWGSDSCPTKGVVLLTGAAGSQARGTFRNDGFVTIEYHTGDYVWTTDNIYACSSFES